MRIIILREKNREVLINTKVYLVDVRWRKTSFFFFYFFRLSPWIQCIHHVYVKKQKKKIQKLNIRESWESYFYWRRKNNKSRRVTTGCEVILAKRTQEWRLWPEIVFDLANDISGSKILHVHRSVSQNRS